MCEGQEGEYGTLYLRRVRNKGGITSVCKGQKGEYGTLYLRHARSEGGILTARLYPLRTAAPSHYHRTITTRALSWSS